MESPARRARPALRLLAAALGGGLAGAGAGGAWLASPWGGYLSLQAASDPVHLTVVLTTPAALVLLIGLWMLSELGKESRRLGRLGRTLAPLALAVLTGGPALAVVFDLGLERRGLEGELWVPDPAAARPGPFGLDGAPWPVLGTQAEESAERPGVASAPLPDGSALVLDRRTLARKRPDGSFAWSRSRPGRPPGGLASAGGQVLVTGHGPDHEDDLVLSAVELESGRLLWRLHVLGWSVSPPVVAGAEVAFVAARPATCELHVIEPGAPANQLHLRLPGACLPLPPRLGPERIEVAVGPDLVRFSRRTPWLPPDRQPACLSPGRWEVACRDGQVVAWAPAEEHPHP
jgi:hypothetical protein